MISIEIILTDRLTSYINIKIFNFITDFKLNENPSLNNHWFSGFADVTAFFQILVKNQPINNLTVNKSTNEIEYKIILFDR